MTTLNYKELQKLAKANGLPSVMVKKEKLIEVLTEKGVLPIQTKTIKKENPKKKDEFIEIPKELEYLKLTPVKKKILDEVNIDHLVNTKLKLQLPKSVEERLKREGYQVRFITEPHVQEVMERGAEIIKDDQGHIFKFDSQGCNERGERIYHIAMKIRNDILEKEANLQRQESSSRTKGLKKGGNLTSEDGKLKLKMPENTKYLKHTIKEDVNP